MNIRLKLRPVHRHTILKKGTSDFAVSCKFIEKCYIIAYYSKCLAHVHLNLIKLDQMSIAKCCRFWIYRVCVNTKNFNMIMIPINMKISLKFHKMLFCHSTLTSWSDDLDKWFWKNSFLQHVRFACLAYQILKKIFRINRSIPA